MAKKALLKKEEIAAVPLTEEVLIETADPETPVVEQKSAPVEVDNDLVKRLADLEKSEKAAQERAVRAEAEVATSRQQVTQATQERDQFKDSTEQAQFDAILNAIGAAQAEADTAERDMLAASVMQDVPKQIEAQRRLARSESRLERLEEGKQAFETRRELQKEAAKNPPPQTDQFEGQISRLPETAKTWLRGHRDYITDQRKNAKIQALHWDVLDEGHQAFSAPYFESLEVHLGMKEKPEPDRTDTVVSAPVSRDAQSLSTGRPVSTKVTLTPEEREIAKMTGVDERVYAQNKLKLQELKKNGFYQER